MKLIDVLNNIDKSNKEDIDLYEFEREFSADYSTLNWDSFISQTRLTSYWIKMRLCTDVVVGDQAYFFDDELVCYSSKFGRKWNKTFKWASVDAYNKVKQFFESLCAEDDKETIELLNPQTEIEEYYSLNNLHCEILDYHYENAFYEGEKIEILKSNIDKLNHNVKLIGIKKQNGEVLDVDGKLIKFKIPLREK